jgi:hypothetical protein
VKTGQESAAYLVFVLRACGEANTELLKICPGTSDAEAAIRDRVARLKANWGYYSTPQRVIAPGEVAKDGGKLES